MIKEFRDTGYFIDTEGVVYGKRCILKPCPNYKGYLKVYLSCNKEKLTLSVHRMVAETFIPNPENKPEVNHIDGDKTNNTVENLEWVTSKENSWHSVNVLGNLIGEDYWKSTITNQQAITICEMIQDGYRTIDISRKLDINLDKIRSIKKRSTWKHISKDYNFPKGNSDHGISDNTFIWICHQLQAGFTSPEIIKKYVGGGKLTPQNISSIRTRKFRPHLSKDFNF